MLEASVVTAKLRRSRQDLPRSQRSVAETDSSKPPGPQRITKDTNSSCRRQYPAAQLGSYRVLSVHLAKPIRSSDSSKGKQVDS
jgi:hypothetical protein